jgi:hypothetical protein
LTSFIQPISSGRPTTVLKGTVSRDGVWDKTMEW